MCTIKMKKENTEYYQYNALLHIENCPKIEEVLKWDIFSNGGGEQEGLLERAILLGLKDWIELTKEEAGKRHSRKRNKNKQKHGNKKHQVSHIKSETDINKWGHGLGHRASGT